MLTITHHKPLVEAKESITLNLSSLFTKEKVKLIESTAWNRKTLPLLLVPLPAEKFSINTVHILWKLKTENNVDLEILS